MSKNTPHVAEKSTLYQVSENKGKLENWPQVPLAEVVELNPKVDRGLMNDNFEVSFVPMAAVGAATGCLETSTVRKYGEVKKGYTYFRDGDVLFAKITPCMENGKMVVARGLRNGVGFGSTEFHVLRPRSGVEAGYIYHFVSNATFRAEAAHHMTGAVGQKRVPLLFLEQARIPLPPSEQQKRIVAEIEKQFSRIEEAVANLKRVKANLKRYKVAVLKAAVEGRLVETEAELARREGRSYETGAQLIRRILETRRSQWKGKGKYKEPAAPDTIDLPELPEGWVVASIGQASECLDSMRVPINKRERLTRLGNVPYYGANGRVGFINDFIFDEPLVLVVEDETFTGRELPFSYKISGKAWVNNHAHVLRPTGMITWDYLNYSLSYYPFTARTTGTTGRKKLTQAALVSAPLAVPPVAEQRRIVAEIDRHLSLILDAELIVEANLKRAERLRQSVLADTFSGKLSRQDASLGVVA
jgi:type I restriction enzyme S subunit